MSGGHLYPSETCRSCPAEIIWAVTKNGYPMPVDAAPVQGGNIRLEERAGQPLALVVKAALAEGRTDLRRSHFATCNRPDMWRRPR